MKKIINGKVYNTDTAECIGSYDNGYNYGDFQYYSEDLYRTKNGSYFIYGVGGATSKYNKQCGNMRSGSSDIIVLDEDDAKRWAQEYITADEYLDIWGDVTEA